MMNLIILFLCPTHYQKIHQLILYRYIQFFINGQSLKKIGNELGRLIFAWLVYTKIEVCMRIACITHEKRNKSIVFGRSNRRVTYISCQSTESCLCALSYAN
jgi:hypothetical protein